MDRFDELVEEYLDGALDSRGREELSRLVEADPGRLRTLVELVRQHRVLSIERGTTDAEEFIRRVVRGVDRGKTQFIHAVMDDVRGGGPGVPRKARRPIRPRPPPRPGLSWLAWGAFAAGTLVFLAVILLASGGGDDARRPDRRPGKDEARNLPDNIPSPPGPVIPRAPEVEPSPGRPAPPPPRPGAPEPAPELKVVRGADPARPREPEPRKSDPPPPPPPPPVPAPVPVPETKTTRAEVARLDRAEGAVTLVLDGAKVAVQAGQALGPGFQVETGEGSSAGLLYPDGTRVELLGGSRLRDLTERGGRRLGLDGAILAEVAKQPPDQPLIFATVQAEAKVLGTKLALEAAQDLTRLTVSEGRVLLTRLKDRTSVTVEASHTAVAAPGIPLASRLARVQAGLLALYTFKEGRGTTVRDVSRAGSALDLRIENEASVRWSPRGLSLVAPTLVASREPATKITQAVKGANELSVEAWFRPATATPAGKDGRILSLSADPFNQNTMVGQDEANGPARSYFFRLRTTRTDLVGKPALATPEGAVLPKLTHLVCTRTADGTAILYVDGQERARAAGAGDLSAWGGGYRLGLGNEFTNDRPWLGEYHLVALYGRALGAEDVKENFRAGTE